MPEKENIEIQPLYNKEAVLKEIEKEIASREARMVNSRLPAAYHLAQIQLLKQLLVRAKRTEFLNFRPNKNWLYVLHQDECSFKIEILNVQFGEDRILDVHNILFLEEKAKLLSAEQYGAIYKVGAGSVRQWIRRGKLPGAMKIGSVWRISELSIPKSRGYDFRFYAWDKGSNVFEKELEYLNEYDAVSLEQLKDGNFFIIPRKKNAEGLLLNVVPLSKNPNQEGITMDAKEKESFELQLIENPLVNYSTVNCFEEEGE